MLDGDEFETNQFAGRGVVDRIDDVLLRLDELRRQPRLVAAVVGVLAVVAVTLWVLGRPPQRAPVEERIPIVELAPSVPATTDPVPAVVHVAGAVARPGVYSLAAGSRVLDAIEAAGGAVSEADLDQLNLAAVVVDGVQIRVPVEGEVLAVPLVGADATAAAGPVDLNRATLAQLESLPGIGPATAASIDTWRQDNGPFTVVEDLLLVPGIGPAKLAGLADLVVVR